MKDRNYKNTLGCFTGLPELLAAAAVYQWMQSCFGFGDRSCRGLLLFCVFIMMVLGIFFNVDWTDFSF